jgi:Tol biopolymer transport system component
VVFNLNGTLQTDDTAPYDFTNWTPAVGSYTLTATPYSGAGGTGTPGTPLTIHFTVTGSRILYEHNDHIYSINPDGSDRQDLGAGYAPAWSPDGTKIAFHAHGSGGREIYLMNADGSNRVRLTNNNIDDRNPAFSPDGSRIVYGSVITGADWELWVMNADGTNKVQITNNSIDDKDPQWSSTDWIVFTANPGDYAQLYKMRPDGSQRTRLINSTVSTTSPEWSPDGSYIVYTRIGGTYTDIYRINADGTNALRLTTDPAVDQNPCFSPDGQQILFSSLRNPGSFNYFELYSITVDGSNETRLTTTGSWDEQRCAWGYP